MAKQWGESKCFAIHDENGYVVPVEGIEMKTLVYGGGGRFWSGLK